VVQSCGCVLLGVVVAVGVTPRADAQNPPTIKLGMLQGMFKDVPDSVVHIAARPFSDLFREQVGVGGDVEIVADCQTLAARMKDKELHVGVFHGFEFAWVRDRYPELQPLAVTRPHRTMQACLVVHKDSPAAGPKDLKGACVAVPHSPKAHCQVFLDRLRADLPAGCCCPAKHDPMSPEEVLDAVAQGRLSSALVDTASLTTYQSDRPGLYRELRKLCESEAFPPGVIAYRTGGLDPKAVAKIREGLIKLHETGNGRGFLMLWKLKGFENVPADFDAQMRRIAKAYPAPGPGNPPADKDAPPR
jgi:ABC-type phosphate/phosphonate transport system substrate-binding protein